jgi:hypothetical protein
MPSYGKNIIKKLGFTGAPPSRLGFVCKPDMPPHINILFRARPPLEFVPKPSKGHSRTYKGFINGTTDIIDKFEKTEPPKRVPVEGKRGKHVKQILQSIEKTRAENMEKECKYLLIYKYLLVRRYISYF